MRSCAWASKSSAATKSFVTGGGCQEVLAGLSQNGTIFDTLIKKRQSNYRNPELRPCLTSHLMQQNIHASTLSSTASGTKIFLVMRLESL